MGPPREGGKEREETSHTPDDPIGLGGFLFSCSFKHLRVIFAIRFWKYSIGPFFIIMRNGLMDLRHLIRVAPGFFLLLFPSRSGVFPIVSCCRGRAMCGASIGEDSSCCRSHLGCW